MEVLRSSTRLAKNHFTQERTLLLITPLVQFLAQFFHWQTDDVAVRTGDFGDDEFAMLLNGVGPGLVERIDAGKIIADLPRIQRMKQHVGAGGKRPFPMAAQMHQANPGDNLMVTALQPRQHLARVGKVARLGENFIIQKNQRIRAENERVGNFLGHGTRLAMGVKLANFEGRKVFMGDFYHLTRQYPKLHG